MSLRKVNLYNTLFKIMRCLEIQVSSGSSCNLFMCMVLTCQKVSIVKIRF